MGWKISDKPTVDPKDTDLALIEQDGNTRNTTWAKLKAFFLGTATLTTTDQTIKGAINEVKASTDANTTSLSDRAYNCNVTNSLNITIANSTMTAIPFDTNVRDSKNMHSTTVNNTRVTILKAGNYNIVGAIGWDSNSVGTRQACIRINGTNYIGVSKLGAISDSMIMQALAQVYLNVNDYIELTAYQNSGSSLNVTKSGLYSPTLSVQKVGD